MFAEILKIVLPFLGGGLTGALLNEWFRRRSGKLQSIPLIERVNRRVSPELEGFTLAPVIGDPRNQQLEEVENVREYQLTLRNTATIHLQNVEIQFEFPTEDIEGWVSRPALSKTAPIPIEAVVTPNLGRGASGGEFRICLPRIRLNSVSRPSIQHLQTTKWRSITRTESSLKSRRVNQPSRDSAGWATSSPWLRRQSRL